MTYTSLGLNASGLGLFAAVLLGCAGGTNGAGVPMSSQPVTQWELITASTDVSDVVHVEGTDDYVVASPAHTTTAVLEGPLDQLVSVALLESQGNVDAARVWTDGDSVIVSTQFGPYIPVLAERRNGSWQQHWEAIGYTVYPIAATSRDDVFLSATERVVHFDGTEVHEVPLEVTSLEIRAALKVAGGALWGLGRVFPDDGDSVHQWSGTAWELDSTVPQGEHLEALWGDDSGPRFAVGSGIYTRTGEGWTRSHSGLSLTAIAGDDDHDLYAIGDAGTVLHFDGSAWSTVEVPTTQDLLRVSISAREILIVTADHKVLRGLRD